MRLIQVTLGAAATQITANANFYAISLTIQNNSAAVCRVGDDTVSATQGLSLAATGGSATFTFPNGRGTHLQDWYLFGTSGDVIDILYETT